MIDNRLKVTKRKPWMKWYPADWRGEQLLRLVSREARSVWVDLLGLMHESTLIGTLFVNGKIPSVETLAKMFGDDPQKLSGWIAELVENGVCSVDDDGALYSRKMRNAAEISEKGRLDVQKRGGAWAPGKKPAKPNKKADGDPNRVPNGDPTPQRLEARIEERKKETEAKASEGKPSVSTPPQAASPLDLQKELWGRGVSYLKANGASDSHARSLIGKWRKQLGGASAGGDFAVLQLLAKAEAETVAEPVAFIEAHIIAKGKPNGRPNGRDQGQPRTAFDVFAEGYLDARAERERLEREAARH